MEERIKLDESRYLSAKGGIIVFTLSDLLMMILIVFFCTRRSKHMLLLLQAAIQANLS